MNVAVVVLNHNGNDDTLECLRSLEKAAYRPRRLIVVDNASDPPLRPRLEASGIDARLLESGVNLGFTGGGNLGMRAALDGGAEAVLLLNNDTVVDPGFLEPLVGALRGDARLGIVAPKIYFHGRDRVIWAQGARIGPWTGRSPHIGVYEKDRGQHDGVREVDRVTGCAMLVRREFIERVGLLDDRFFVYGEEIDWCLRGRRAGYRMAVVKDSVIWHKGHRTSGRRGRPFIAYFQTRNHLLMLRKHSGFFAAGAAVAVLYHALAAGAAVLGGVVRGDLATASAVLRGVGDYWAGRFGPRPGDARPASSP